MGDGSGSTATAALDPDLAGWLADPLRRRRAWMAVCVAAISSFLFVVDSGFVSLSLPKIEAEFPLVHRGVIEWVATGFMVMQASLLLVAGRLGDRRGRKRFFLYGLVSFSVGSMCTAVAPNLPLIIAARAFTGAGAAFLTAGTLAIVLPMFPASKAGEVIGYWGAFGSIAGWLTPLVGPVLVHSNWRWAFAVITPIGLLAALLGWRVLPEQFGDLPPGRTDRISLLVGPPALGLLMLVLSSGRSWGWTSPVTLTLSVVVVLLLTALVHRSTHTEHSLLDTDILRRRGYSANLVAAVLQQSGFFAFFITAPLIMINVWHWSVADVGFAVALSQLPGSLGSSLGGRMVARYGYRRLIAAGALIAGLGVAWMTLTATSTPHVWTGYVPGALAFGFGCSLCGTLAPGAALAALPVGLLGTGNSLAQLVRRMGGAIGVAIAYALLGDAKGPALLDGGRRVWWFVVVVHALAMVSVLVLTERRVGSQHREPTRLVSAPAVGQ